MSVLIHITNWAGKWEKSLYMEIGSDVNQINPSLEHVVNCNGSVIWVLIITKAVTTFVFLNLQFLSQNCSIRRCNYFPNAQHNSQTGCHTLPAVPLTVVTYKVHWKIDLRTYMEESTCSYIRRSVFMFLLMHWFFCACFSLWCVYHTTTFDLAKHANCKHFQKAVLYHL